MAASLRNRQNWSLVLELLRLGVMLPDEELALLLSSSPRERLPQSCWPRPKRSDDVSPRGQVDWEADAKLADEFDVSPRVIVHQRDDHQLV